MLLAAWSCALMRTVPAAKLAQGRQFGFDSLVVRPYLREQAFTGFSRRDAARATREEPDAQSFLQSPNGMAERRLRHAKLGGCAGEAALTRHHDESQQVVEVYARHL